MKKVYNKLVRDRIPRVIEADGHKCKIHEATPEEFRLKLNEKLQEEIAEFLTAPNAEEMADILEVLETMRKEYRIDLDDVRYQKESKMVNKGGFERKLILEWTKNLKLAGPIIRDGSHAHINNGSKKLRKDFKTSGQK